MINAKVSISCGASARKLLLCLDYYRDVSRFANLLTAITSVKGVREGFAVVGRLFIICFDFLALSSKLSAVLLPFTLAPNVLQLAVVQE